MIFVETTEKRKKGNEFAASTVKFNQNTTFFFKPEFKMN